jgi:hypothetical protein
MLYSHIPLFPLIRYNITFVQCRFTEQAAFKGHTPMLDEGLQDIQLISKENPNWAKQEYTEYCSMFYVDPFSTAVWKQEYAISVPSVK